MKNIEKIFYKKHSKKIRFMSFNESSKKIEKDFFSKGKRYSIVQESLSKKRIYDLLVEIGPGKGATLKYLNEKFNFKKLVGIDLILDNKIKINEKNIKLIQGNFNYKVPIKNGKVDILILMMVIEHLFDPFHSFAEIKRLLKKDGIAFINLPLITSIKNRLRVFFGKLPETSVSYNEWFKLKEWDGNHLHYFSIKSIKKLCEVNQLKMIKIQPVGKFLFFKKIFPSLFCNEISISIKKK